MAPARSVEPTPTHRLRRSSRVADEDADLTRDPVSSNHSMLSEQQMSTLSWLTRSSSAIAVDAPPSRCAADDVVTPPIHTADRHLAPASSTTFAKS